MTLLQTPPATSPPPDAGEPVDRRWTREEYDRLVTTGFFDGQRIELVEGRLVQMSPQRPAHAVAIELVVRYLRPAFGDGHWIRNRLPFNAADDSDPEPDVAVITGGPRDSAEHPSRALLIVEIAQTTIWHDRRKARLYAASGVPEYWILNIVDRNLEVYREPLPAGGSAAGPAYATARVLQPADTIAPLHVPAATITVADLLP